MGWYRAHRSFNQEPEIIDNCLFCGSHKKIKRTDFTIVFSEYEYNTGNICVEIKKREIKFVKILKLFKFLLIFHIQNKFLNLLLCNDPLLIRYLVRK